MKLFFLLTNKNPLENLNNLLEDFLDTLKTSAILLSLCVTIVLLIYYFIRNKR